MRRTFRLFSVALLLPLMACVVGLPVTTPNAEVDRITRETYAGDYQAFVDNELSLVAGNIADGNMAFVQHMASKGVSMRNSIRFDMDSMASIAQAGYVKTRDPKYLEIMKVLFEDLDVRPWGDQMLFVAYRAETPEVLEILLPYANWRPDQCGNSGLCKQSLIEFDRAFNEYLDPRNPADIQMRKMLVEFAYDPANAHKMRDLGLTGDTVAALEQNTAMAWLGGNSGGSNRAGLSLLGSLGGSLLGGAIGGSDGQLMGDTFSSIMNTAATADSGAEVMTGTFTSVLGGAGIMDAGTAESVNLIGQMFGNSDTAQTASVAQNGTIARTATPATSLASSVSNVSGAAAGGDDYQFSCPMGSGPHRITIPTTKIPGCADAMRQFAYTSSCNLIDQMEEAQRSYYSICAAEIYQ